jgi:hypothetical protein
LRAAPVDFDAWVEALGATGAAQAAPRIRAALERLAPGMFSVKLEGAVPGVVINQARSERLRAVASCIAAHSAKLGNAYARGRVPLDDRLGTEGLEHLLGAHQVEAADSFDYSGNAADIPYFRQIGHALAGQGRYRLAMPMGAAIAPAIVEQVGRIEEVARGVLERAEFDDSGVHFGVPQLLFPDEASSSGYLSVTPLACGAVLARLDRTIRDRREARALLELGDPARPGHVRTAGWMEAVAKRQNLSAVVGSVRSVLAACPPVTERAVIEALSIRRSPEDWACRLGLQRAVHVQSYRVTVGEFVRQLARQLEAEASDAQRQRLGRLTDELVFPIAWRWASIVWERPELFVDTPWDAPGFDGRAGAAVLARVIKVHADEAGVVVSSALVEHWRLRAEQVLERVLRTVRARHADVAVDLA